MTLKDWAILGGVVAIFGGGTWIVYRERAIGAAQERTKVERARGDSIAKVVTSTAQKAATDSVKAEQARQAALAQVRRSEALRRAQDSLVKASTEARHAAEGVLADSLASVAHLRQTLGALVEQSRRDSASADTQRTTDRATIRTLLTALQADSVALTAERQHSAALSDLKGSIQQQLDAERALKPSKVGAVVEKVLWTAAGGGVGYLIGKASK